MTPQREQLGQWLGLDAPVSEAVWEAAVENEEYAQNLMLARHSGHLLNALLASPPPVTFSHAELVQRAGKAFARWARSGFSTVDQGVLALREETCLACDKLQRPAALLQKLVTSAPQPVIGKRAADSICGVCGCSISKKIRLASESCPLGRWAILSSGS